MSVMVIFYLAADDEQALAFNSDPDQFPDNARFGGFTILELSMLWSALRNTPLDGSSIEEFPNVFLEGEGELTIYRLPAALVASLAQSTSDQLASAATKWAATEEMHCSPGDLAPIIQGLVRLAQKASLTGQNIYFWNCV